MIRNKRGQFYLVAAIAIILIILSLAVIPNNLSKEGPDNTKLYELFAEVNIDDAKMLNYPDTTGTGLLGYTEANLENIFDKMTDVYTGIDKIYILINKGNTPKLYIYDKSGKVGNKITDVYGSQQIILSSLKIEDEDTTYNFGGVSGNFYYIIIIEKSENLKTRQQYVVKG